MNKLTIKIMTRDDEDAYKKFILSNDRSLFFYSLQYKHFLSNVLTESRDYYFLAYKGENIVGVLPSFLKSNKSYGDIINSLPFFGSHGGVLIGDDPDGKIKESLINKFDTFSREQGVIAATIIDNLNFSNKEFYDQELSPLLVDERVGQITDLTCAQSKDIQSQLMLKFHTKTRNLVRKALKSDFIVYHETGNAAFKLLHGIHLENMQAIGGTAKPLSVFSAIQAVFNYDEDYRLYFAKKNGQIAAALLVFYFKDYCEYFTPVIKENFRSEQPLSALIFRAMEDALLKGCHLWNWGGTHISQKQLYHFKSRWGAQDVQYHYYTKIYDQLKIDAIFHQMLAPAIIEQYRYYYVKPF